MNLKEARKRLSQKAQKSMDEKEKYPDLLRKKVDEHLSLIQEALEKEDPEDAERQIKNLYDGFRWADAVHLSVEQVAELIALKVKVDPVTFMKVNDILKNVPKETMQRAGEKTNQKLREEMLEKFKKLKK